MSTSQPTNKMPAIYSSDFIPSFETMCAILLFFNDVTIYDRFLVFRAFSDTLPGGDRYSYIRSQVKHWFSSDIELWQLAEESDSFDVFAEWYATLLQRYAPLLDNELLRLGHVSATVISMDRAEQGKVLSAEANALFSANRLSANVYLDLQRQMNEVWCRAWSDRHRAVNITTRDVSTVIMPASAVNFSVSLNFPKIAPRDAQDLLHIRSLLGYPLHDFRVRFVSAVNYITALLEIYLSSNPELPPDPHTTCPPAQELLIDFLGRPYNELELTLNRHAIAYEPMEIIATFATEQHHTLLPAVLNEMSMQSLHDDARLFAERIGLMEMRFHSR